MAHDVFVSYSSEDKPVADAACARLEAAGIRCWIAPRDVLPGEPWGAAIVRAIGGARVMVLVFSSAANGSRQIWHEVERAVSRGLPLIPLRIEDVAPSETLEYYISATHWLDALTEPLEEHLGRLEGVVATLLERAEGRTGSPGAGVRGGGARTPLAPGQGVDPALAPRRVGDLPRRPRRRALALALLALAAGGWLASGGLRSPGPAAAPPPAEGPPPASTQAPARAPPAPLSTGAPGVGADTDARAQAIRWLERGEQDRSAFYERGLAPMLWALAWARTGDDVRARQALERTIAASSSSESDFIPPEGRSDLFTLLARGMVASGGAEGASRLAGEITKREDRIGVEEAVVLLRLRSGGGPSPWEDHSPLPDLVRLAPDGLGRAIGEAALARVYAAAADPPAYETHLALAREALRGEIASDLGGGSSGRRWRILQGVAMLARALGEAGDYDEAVAFLKDLPPGLPVADLHADLAASTAERASLERLTSLLEVAGVLPGDRTCLIDFAAAEWMAGIDDDFVVARALPPVVQGLLAAGRFEHVARLAERVQPQASRIPVLCALASALARAGRPADALGPLEVAEPLVAFLDDDAERALALAFLLRARTRANDAAGAGRLQVALDAALPRLASGPGVDEDAQAIRAWAVATARVARGSWTALEEDLRGVPDGETRLLIHIAVANALFEEAAAR